MNAQQISRQKRFSLSKRFLVLNIVSIAAFAPGCTQHVDPLQQSAKVLGAAELKSIEFSGAGRWYQFGQAPNPTSAWPPFDVSNYTAAINYDTAAARVQITRKQTIEPGRERPAPVEQKPDQYVSEAFAWNLAVPQGAPADTAPTAQAQPAATEERASEIWTTPQGFLKAALANNATVKKVDGGSAVEFTANNHRYQGHINAQYQVDNVKTWIDNPVLGDTPIEYSYSDYKSFENLAFPTHIVRKQGGYPVLDLTINSVKINIPVEIAVPDEVRAADATKINVTSEQLADGVYYLRGGTHHSVAIEQKNHIVVVEAPLNEQRSLAVIAKVKELIPNKPIAYLINTHQHFDHSGGLRTYVDEGAVIVTQAQNKSYYEQAWAAPHTLNPDRLSASKRAAKFETFTDGYVLDDAQRKIEIHSIAGSGHNDAFALVYLPAQKILIEADAYTPLAANASRPASVNPYSINLYDNVKRLNLSVDKIAALHGPGVVKLADLEDFISAKNASR